MNRHESKLLHPLRHHFNIPKETYILILPNPFMKNLQSVIISTLVIYSQANKEIQWYKFAVGAQYSDKKFHVSSSFLFLE